MPVAVDPRKRIMPFSSNPFINFEMNKPAGKNKDINLDYEMINNLLVQTPENIRGDEASERADDNASEAGSEEDDD